jgi:DNA polymerase III alpha subunit
LRNSSGKSLANLQPKRELTLIAGIVTSLRVQASRRGKMAFVTLDDGAGSAEVMVYNETFDAARALLREDQLVIAEVKVQQRMTDDGQSQGLRIIVENLYDLPAIRKRFAKGPANCLQRQCASRSSVRAAASVPQRHVSDCRRVSQLRCHGRARIAGRLARCP